MGKRGPKPKPTQLRVLEGNPGRLPINHNEPKPTGVPECPAYLCEDAKTKWDDIMSSVPPGMFTLADSPLVEAFCEAWATHKQATEALRASMDLLGNNLVTDDKPSVYLKIRNDAAKTMATLSTRLGLSPADRTGIKVDAAPGRNRFMDLING